MSTRMSEMPARAAKERLHGRTNDEVRKFIKDTIQFLPTGWEIKTDTLTRGINAADTRRNYSNARTGRLLSDLPGVKRVGPGVWQVVR